MKPAYFDFSVTDLEAARRFFENVFGWRFARFPMPYEYYTIQAGEPGEPGEPGFDGGIAGVDDTPLTGGRPLTLVTVPVDDLDAMIAKVEAGGGTVVEAKMAIPGTGWYATCAEPGGLMFGMVEADPDAA